MTDLDLFSIGSWTIFDHILRMERLPHEGETITLDMPVDQIATLHFGDCSANIAATAARLGIDVGLGMVVGSDFETSGYRQHLSKLRVDLNGVEVFDHAHSGHSFNFFDSANRGFCVSHLGLASDQSSWQTPIAAIDRARALVACEMFSSYTLAAIEHAKSKGRLTAINGMVATAGPLVRRFLAATDILFLSRAEFGVLCTELGISDAAALFDHGPRLVVVTEGSKGSIWHEPTAAISAPAVQARRFVDSTGAGDSFVAGALYGILRGLPVIETARCAATVASFVVEEWGCQTNLPSIGQVRERYHEFFGEALAA